MTLLSANHISFAYQLNQPVFKNISFNINPGAIFTILGPNGVGKSTLLKCLLGLNRPQAGKITINGTDINQLTRRQIARQVAYVPQDYQTNTNLSVMDYLLTARAPFLNILQAPGKKDYHLISKRLQKFGLSKLQDKPFSALSGGQQQLIAIIKALVQEPQLLILDEPMAALDLNRQKKVLAILKSLATSGMAIILTTHLPDHVFLLDSAVGLFYPDGPAG
jgi:iron complex transport system ATP-binding protein